MACSGARPAACWCGLKLEGEASEPADIEPDSLPEATRWYADSDIGRRYAKVCGDYNPIHLSAVSARLFGFPRPLPMACGARPWPGGAAGICRTVAMPLKWTSASRCGCRRRWCSVPVRRAFRSAAAGWAWGGAAYGRAWDRL
jgi:hypothetical protein